MSSTGERFPCARCPSDPPLLWGTLVDGKQTLLYGLGWVCSPQQLSRNLGGVTTLGGRYSEEIMIRWNGPHALTPRGIYAQNGKFYLVAVWNTPPHPGMTREDIVEQARKVMGVDKDSKLEQTFMWYRLPLSWVGRKKMTRKRHWKRWQLDRWHRHFQFYLEA
ncbi:hypothetical protein BDP27DRAFT_1426484 [Rhodocollybia butyracea]|uniref:Uncharacterized protein n=1 Tax=Rhodocollybia butyracea TaxID=206335 RepID=A0A9P5U2U2_9AGAR|nr:hypothetical protein BDP27DRAFT_1426484 [Rhodocollybia butyracea]